MRVLIALVMFVQTVAGGDVAFADLPDAAEVYIVDLSDRPGDELACVAAHPSAVVKHVCELMPRGEQYGFGPDGDVL